MDIQPYQFNWFEGNGYEFFFLLRRGFSELTSIVTNLWWRTLISFQCLQGDDQTDNNQSCLVQQICHIRPSVWKPLIKQITSLITFQDGSADNGCAAAVRGQSARNALRKNTIRCKSSLSDLLARLKFCPVPRGEVWWSGWSGWCGWCGRRRTAS